ncbi:MAG: hypothetical protein IAE82_05615 [Opitutaceae bacterium]|nr:hypothetical protein [Opitutaceae bacterium]
MREAHSAAKAKLGTDHPFCTHRSATDGREILLHTAQAEGDGTLVDITADQREFARMVEPRRWTTLLYPALGDPRWA